MPIAIDQSIRTRIDAFVVELHDLILQAAVASVTAAFGGSRVDGSSGATRAATPRRRASRRPRSNGTSSTRTGNGRRDPEALAALTEKLRTYIVRTPGRRIEDIARALGTTTKALQLPARKLVGARQVSTRGVKRATTYYAA